jgi:hypothetical protein
MGLSLLVECYGRVIIFAFLMRVSGVCFSVLFLVFRFLFLEHGKTPPLSDPRTGVFDGV